MYVIFGASGQVGRATITALRGAGHAVRAVVRDASRAESLVRIGCDVVVADLDDAASVTQALKGAHAVQVLCPLPYNAPDLAAAMRRTVEATARVLRDHSGLPVVVLSDYGAQIGAGAGFATCFHQLEAAFVDAVPHVTLLRSAQHMENWVRLVPVALETGRLPSLQHPLDAPMPMVSAADVGAVCAELLTAGLAREGRRLESVEGPRRFSALDVAQRLGDVAQREISAFALPRDAWEPTLRSAGLGASLIQLVIETNDAQNDGRIDVEPGSERRFGTTDLRDVLAMLVAQRVSSSPSRKIS